MGCLYDDELLDQSLSRAKHTQTGMLLVNARPTAWDTSTTDAGGMAGCRVREATDHSLWRQRLSQGKARLFDAPGCPTARLASDR